MTLVTMCETRWVLRHDCIKRFKEMFIPIVNALEHLEKSVNKETSNYSSSNFKSYIKW